MTITVSTVTPVYSGEKYLVDLVEKIADLKSKWASNNSPLVLAETIFVDDGSIDNSAQVLANLNDQYPWGEHNYNVA